MTDITKCAGIRCEIKETCWRYTAPPSVYQSYCEFNSEYGGKPEPVRKPSDCGAYWEKPQ